MQDLINTIQFLALTPIIFYIVIKPQNTHMNTSKNRSIFQLLMFGGILAVAKLVYLFFDPYNILDLIVFAGAGVVLGGKVPAGKRSLGLLLCLPTFLLCLAIVINLGYTSIVNGIGTSYAISLIVLPVATVIGLFINAKLAFRKSFKE
jgi:hypothetical protein